MENISPLPSDIRRSFGSIGATNKQLDNVVMISNHTGWPARHKFRSDEGTESEIATDTVHLTRVFHEVLERVKQGPVLSMDDESVTIGQKIDQIWRRFPSEDRPVPLSQILRQARSERSVICTFLALLELNRLDAIVLRQDRNFSEILIRRSQLPAPSF